MLRHLHPPCELVGGDTLNDQRQLLLPFSDFPARAVSFVSWVVRPQNLAVCPVKNDTTGENAVRIDPNYHFKPI